MSITRNNLPFPASPDSTSSADPEDASERRSASPARSMHRAVLSKAQAVEIYLAAQAAREGGVDPLQGGISARLAKRYGVSPKAIRDIWNRRTWTHETRHLWAANEQPMIRYKKLPAMAACRSEMADTAGWSVYGHGGLGVGGDTAQRPAYCSFFSPQCGSYFAVAAYDASAGRSWAAADWERRDGGHGGCSGVRSSATAQPEFPYLAATPPSPCFPEYMAGGDGFAAEGGGWFNDERCYDIAVAAAAAAANAERTWDGPVGLLAVDAAGDSDPFHGDWAYW